MGIFEGEKWGQKKAKIDDFRGLQKGSMGTTFCLFLYICAHEDEQDIRLYDMEIVKKSARYAGNRIKLQKKADFNIENSYYDK